MAYLIGILTVADLAKTVCESLQTRGREFIRRPRVCEFPQTRGREFYREFISSGLQIYLQLAIWSANLPLVCQLVCEFITLQRVAFQKTASLWIFTNSWYILQTQPLTGCSLYRPEKVQFAVGMEIYRPASRPRVCENLQTRGREKIHKRAAASL